MGRGTFRPSDSVTKLAPTLADQNRSAEICQHVLATNNNINSPRGRLGNRRTEGGKCQIGADDEGDAHIHVEELAVAKRVEVIFRTVTCTVLTGDRMQQWPAE